MKLKKILTILVLALVLVWYFLPGGTETGGAQTVPAQNAQTAPQSDSGNGGLTLLPSGSDGGIDTSAATETATSEETGEAERFLDENGSYTTKEDLALYIHTYGHLPPNFIPKKEAEKAGWDGGSLDRVLPGMCIGGDYFGNNEGLLPKAKGRKWTECDVNTLGVRSRGPERIVFSNDGLIYYSPDHYASIEQLY